MQRAFNFSLSNFCSGSYLGGNILRINITRCSSSRYSTFSLASSDARSGDFFSIVDFFSPKSPSTELIMFDGMAKSGLVVNAHSDKEYGGKSSAFYNFIDGNFSYLQFRGTLSEIESESVDANDGIHHAAQMNHDQEQERKPGHVQSQEQRLKQKGSYCALKVDFARPFDLNDFNGLEIIMRSRQRLKIVINLTCETYIDGEICQVLIELAESSAWKKILLPFDSFAVTISGHEKDQTMKNDSLRVQSFGILLRNGASGNFIIGLLCQRFLNLQKTLILYADRAMDWRL